MEELWETWTLPQRRAALMICAADQTVMGTFSPEHFGWQFESWSWKSLPDWIRKMIEEQYERRE